MQSKQSAGQRKAPNAAPTSRSEPQARAARIGEFAERAWHGTGAGADDGACLGVIAAIALLDGSGADGSGVRDQMLRFSDEEIAQALSRVWCLFTIDRPDLAFRCGPFAKWLNAKPRDARYVAAAGAVARAAVKAGILELTLDIKISRSVDLLGNAYMAMGRHGARAARGEFYTPSGAAGIIARIIAEGLRPGQSVCDPAAGTGGLLRPVAEVLRRDRRDPADFRWYACDISPVAVAALAVNAHLWGLGHRIAIACADSLAEVDWPARAVREQREAIEIQKRLADVARLIAGADAPGIRDRGA